MKTPRSLFCFNKSSHNLTSPHTTHLNARHVHSLKCLLPLSVRLETKDAFQLQLLCIWSPRWLAHSSRNQPKPHTGAGSPRPEQILGRFILARQMPLHAFLCVYYSPPPVQPQGNATTKPNFAINSTAPFCLRKKKKIKKNQTKPTQNLLSLPRVIF